MVELLRKRRERLSSQDAAISGWNVGLNSGEAAGQTVFHAHWHLIPRREGGLRGAAGWGAGGDWGGGRVIDFALKRIIPARSHHRDTPSLMHQVERMMLLGQTLRRYRLLRAKAEAAS